MKTAASNTSGTEETSDHKLVLSLQPVEVNQVLRKVFNYIIFDVRDTKDFIKGHVPNAINLPKGSWGKISGLHYAHTLILYCYSNTCSLAAQAMQEFSRHGYPVIQMEGGFEAWKENKLPLEI